MRTEKPLSTIDVERPKPSTVDAVREAAAECTLDPRATPRSNRARLLFALYYCIGLPFPYGWREACVAELRARGIPADTVDLDLLHSAMLTEEVAGFIGWPGIDRQLVEDLLDRLRTFDEAPAYVPPPLTVAPVIRPRISNGFDPGDVERIAAAVGAEHTSRAIARAMAALGFRGRENLDLAHAVCGRLGIRLSDSTLASRLSAA